MIRNAKIGDKFWVQDHGNNIQCTVSAIEMKWRIPIHCATDDKGEDHGWYFGPLCETEEELTNMWLNFSER